MPLGLGKLGDDTLVFSRIDGETFQPAPPNDLPRNWARTVKALERPEVSFHASMGCATRTGPP